jgi:hypothetical protein
MVEIEHRDEAEVDAALESSAAITPPRRSVSATAAAHRDPRIRKRSHRRNLGEAVADAARPPS